MREVLITIYLVVIFLTLVGLDRSMGNTNNPIGKWWGKKSEKTKFGVKVLSFLVIFFIMLYWSLPIVIHSGPEWSKDGKIYTNGPWDYRRYIVVNQTPVSKEFLSDVRDFCASKGMTTVVSTNDESRPTDSWCEYNGGAPLRMPTIDDDRPPTVAPAETTDSVVQ